MEKENKLKSNPKLNRTSDAPHHFGSLPRVMRKCILPLPSLIKFLRMAT